MKEFIEKHEVIIESNYEPTINAKNKEIVPHKKTVNYIYFYKRIYFNEQEVFIKVDITKKFIIDLADKIKYLENQIVDMPYDDNLPF